MSWNVTINPRQSREELIEEMKAGGMPEKYAGVNADMCLDWVKANPNDHEQNLQFGSGNTQ